MDALINETVNNHCAMNLTVLLTDVNSQLNLDALLAEVSYNL